MMAISEYVTDSRDLIDPWYFYDPVVTVILYLAIPIFIIYLTLEAEYGQIRCIREDDEKRDTAELGFRSGGGWQGRVW
jgi:hypothetical protein